MSSVFSHKVTDPTMGHLPHDLIEPKSLGLKTITPGESKGLAEEFQWRENRNIHLVITDDNMTDSFISWISLNLGQQIFADHVLVVKHNCRHSGHKDEWEPPQRLA